MVPSTALSSSASHLSDCYQREHLSRRESKAKSARIGYGKAGGADALLAEVEELAAVGVDWLFLDPPHPSRAAWIEHVQWFGEEVVGRG